MESQDILKPDGQVVIFTDFRETEVSSHLENLGARINTNSLQFGDFVCSEDVCIERKTFSDFASSVIDGRIFSQAKLLSENFKRPVLIIEGSSLNREMSENSLRAALASLIVDFGISVLTTKNPLDTAKMIFWIAKREQTELRKPLKIKFGKKPKEMNRIKEEILASFPGINTVLSKRILEEFSSIESFVKSSENEMVKIKGIGKKLAKTMKKILTEKY